MQDDKILDLVREFMNVQDSRMQELSGYEGGPLVGRLATFHRDFYRGYKGISFGAGVLSRYTWSNLGWRIGAILGVTTAGALSQDEQKQIARLFFDMLSHLQAETIRWHNKNLKIEFPIPIDDFGEESK